MRGKPTTGSASTEDKLKLYGLFKQAKEGDNTASAPWSVQWETKAKWDAWEGVKGKSKDDAMKEYIAEVKAQQEKFGIQPPYDILQQRWKPLEASGTKPLPRQAHSAQRHGRQLVVAGGCAARCFGDVWSFDAQATRWTLRSSEPGVWKQREGHAAAFVGGQMFTFGGCQLSECFNDVSVLETSEPCPEQCGGHGQCVDGLCQCTTPGFTGHDCLQPLSCHQDCGMHGACGHDGQCACSGGFSGARCHLPPVCPGQPLPCSGRGQCLSDGTCRCQAGADGADCFADAKNHSAGAEVRPLQHWAQGLLSLAVPKEPSTQHKKWMRVSASDFGIDKVNEDGHVDAANPDCEDNCHWRGLCDAGVCFCQPGFSGRTCSIAKENTDGTVNIVYTGAMAGVGFLASLGTTLVLLQAQQRQKRQKDTEAGYVG
ncbi:unnamed protein product [Effrenium voratum]|uniref:ACB domain-containing protein n=1 Tax=Effrenium voratum TaxID=2562239 RepID=A0AA36J4T0_9DINO|nr:unnamed protein product [Effrenium voratum]